MMSDSTINRSGYRTNGISNGISNVIQGNNSMSCPDCKTGEIMFNIYELLSGASFSCTNCGVAISLTDATSKEVLKNTMDSMVETLEKKTS